MSSRSLTMDVAFPPTDTPDWDHARTRRNRAVHQRTLPGSGDAGDHDEHAQRDVHVHLAQVVRGRTADLEHLDRARAQAFERSGLAAWEFDVLAVLRRGGPPFRQSPKVLVQQTMVSSGTMTNRIDRMEERGLVRRLTDPNDGRGVLVEMTEQGQTLVDAAMTRLSDAEEQLLGGMPRAERERLAALLRKLALSVDRFDPGL